MKIIIEYESKYSLGTTSDGKIILNSLQNLTENENKSAIGLISDKKDYFENLRQIEKIYPNIKYNDINEKTVLGILSRLVGDVRRLDDIEKDDQHPIMKIKNKIHFKIEKKYFQNELIALHTKIKESTNDVGGLVDKNTKNKIVNDNPFSRSLFSVFNYKNFQDVVQYIIDLQNKNQALLNEKYTGEKIDLNIYMQELFKGDKRFTKDETQQFEQILKSKVNNIYGKLLYEKIEYLKYFNLFTNEINDTLTKNGILHGVTKESGFIGFKELGKHTIKGMKKNWILPYSVKLKFQHIEKESYLNKQPNIGVTKEGGKLIIFLKINKEEQSIIKKYIEEAGVNTFYMGKKGLAYISKIEEE